MSDTELEADLLAALNARVLQVAEQLGFSADDVWYFRCECGEAGCAQRVRLSLSAYRAVRASHGNVLAPGHPLATAEAARVKAAATRESAAGLRAQARLQARRARRNRAAAEGLRRRELICRRCGYGVVVAAPPERCPMCSGFDWRVR